MTNPMLNRNLLVVLLCTAMFPLFAQDVGESVRIHGAIAEDVYAAGGTVDILATVAGDVVAAGGHVAVGQRVNGDVMAAGGAVSVNADVADDVRLAGGDVTISGTIGDDAIAAGGNVTLTPDSTVNGRAWFAGGRIDVAGTVGKELRATGGQIVLSGQVKGDVTLAGNVISILDGAIIDGDLVYRSPRAAEIASGAQIRGTTRYEPVERPTGAIVAAVAGTGIVGLLSLIVTGSALYLLFPRFIGTAMSTIRTEPWKCLGLGLAILAATPIVISVLLFTVIGWLPAIVIGALYLILLLAGFLTGVLYAGDLGRRVLKRGDASRFGQLWSFAVALIVVTLLGFLPLLGTLLLFALLLAGTGSVELGLYRAYIQQSAN